MRHPNQTKTAQGDIAWRTKVKGTKRNKRCLKCQGSMIKAIDDKGNPIWYCPMCGQERSRDGT